MRTAIFVDGFNLYYGAVRKTPYKWLNIAELCKKILPQNEITYIKYFTARINARPNNPHQHLRQHMFLRALKTVKSPPIEIIFGHFLTNETRLPDAKNPKTLRTVIKTEEKGSDVNLAVHLLHDAYLDKYDVAVVHLK